MSENLSEAELIERFQLGLQQMPKLQREIFFAIRLNKMSYAEIAERTGLTARQVERHFERSVFVLLEALEEGAPIPRWKRTMGWIAEKLGR